MTHRDEFGDVVEVVALPHVLEAAVEQDASLASPPPGPPDPPTRHMFGHGTGPGYSCRCAKGAKCGPCLTRDSGASLTGQRAFMSALKRGQDAEFASIVEKLRWGASGEFSASVKPSECRMLLAALGVST
jgi:hypothetical protein